MDELISIIVPVYKVEQYLRKCVESILAQTYRNFELILVDDGSPDTCPQICDEYVEKDQRVKTMHCVNRGVSVARNVGLDSCHGDYVILCDSDDWVEPTYLEILYKAMKKYDADFVQCNVRLIWEDGRTEILLSDLTEDLIFNREEAINSLVLTDLYSGINVMPWGKLFKRKVFETLRFKEGRYHEDDCMNCDVVVSEQFSKAVVLPDVLYDYLQRSNSRGLCGSPKEISDRYFARWYFFESIPENMTETKNKMREIVLGDFLYFLGNQCSVFQPIAEIGKITPEIFDTIKSVVHEFSVEEVLKFYPDPDNARRWRSLRFNLKFGLRICRCRESIRIFVDWLLRLIGY